MNNKGFAISGIIYTLFILFLMILLSILSGLSSFQRLMINSTESFETSFKGEKITNSKLIEVKESGVAPYYGKYIFNITLEDETSLNNCYAYLKPQTRLNKESITMSPSKCNTNIANMELIEIYNFERDN